VTTRETKSNSVTHRSSESVLYLIGVYKLFECAMLIAAGFGIIKLLHRNVSEVAEHVVHAFRIDPENRYIHTLLAKTLSISPKQLKELSIGTFVYASLRFLEGIGLVMRRRWGEYVAVIATALFIPLEIWELFRHFTIIKVVVFLLNVAIVVYMVHNLRTNDQVARSAKAA
jgi:uncharacterized membrane protein (DUF2068 family)